VLRANELPAQAESIGMTTGKIRTGILAVNATLWSSTSTDFGGELSGRWALVRAGIPHASRAMRVPSRPAFDRPLTRWALRPWQSGTAGKATALPAPLQPWCSGGLALR
jgi:hypothetical protein